MQVYYFDAWLSNITNDHGSKMSYVLNVLCWRKDTQEETDFYADFRKRCNHFCASMAGDDDYESPPCQAEYFTSSLMMGL